MKHLLLIGEHDKGLGMAFHPSTVSGQRLRAILADVPAHHLLDNMMEQSDVAPSEGSIARLKHLATRFDAVVLLGARVQKALGPTFPDAVSLPHPGARRPVDLKRLRDGLRLLVGAES